LATSELISSSLGPRSKCGPICSAWRCHRQGARVRTRPLGATTSSPTRRIDMTRWRSSWRWQSHPIPERRLMLGDHPLQLLVGERPHLVMTDTMVPRRLAPAAASNLQLRSRVAVPVRHVHCPADRLGLRAPIRSNPTKCRRNGHSGATYRSVGAGQRSQGQRHPRPKSSALK